MEGWGSSETFVWYFVKAATSALFKDVESGCYGGLSLKLHWVWIERAGQTLWAQSSVTADDVRPVLTRSTYLSLSCCWNSQAVQELHLSFSTFCPPPPPPPTPLQMQCVGETHNYPTTTKLPPHVFKSNTAPWKMQGAWVAPSSRMAYTDMPLPSHVL